jgi:hypothetical protein
MIIFSKDSLSFLYRRQLPLLAPLYPPSHNNFHNTPTPLGRDSKFDRMANPSVNERSQSQLNKG